jgi:hypothetical protein
VEALLGLHDRLAAALVLYLVAAGAWGSYLAIRASGPTPGFRGALVVGEVAIAAHALTGAALLLGRGGASGIHILYGAALLLALPLAATLVRGRTPRATSFALALAAFFAAGLALRGMTTA